MTRLDDVALALAWLKMWRLSALVVVTIVGCATSPTDSVGSGIGDDAVRTIRTPTVSMALQLAERGAS